MLHFKTKDRNNLRLDTLISPLRRNRPLAIPLPAAASTLSPYRSVHFIRLVLPPYIYGPQSNDSFDVPPLLPRRHHMLPYRIGMRTLFHLPSRITDARLFSDGPGRSGVLPSPGTGGREAQLRSASRTYVRCDFLSQARQQILRHPHPHRMPTDPLHVLRRQFKVLCHCLRSG